MTFHETKMEIQFRTEDNGQVKAVVVSNHQEGLKLMKDMNIQYPGCFLTRVSRLSECRPGIYLKKGFYSYGRLPIE